MIKESYHEVSHEVVSGLVKEDWGRLLAALVNYFGDLNLSEDVLQDAIETALDRWPNDGLPDRPDAWVLAVAKRKGLNLIKRSRLLQEKKAELADAMTGYDSTAFDVNDTGGDFGDERLSLIFGCCHPALSMETRVALTLRALGGLTTTEIARAFLVSESTMAQRLVRAKRKIKCAAIPFSIPSSRQLTARVSDVLHVIYFIFNEGYSASSGTNRVREDLCDEAIFLGRMVHKLAPDHFEAAGLLSLMLFHNARRAARTTIPDEVATLRDQDRSIWDRGAIKEADEILTTALKSRQPGVFQIQAAIAGVHAQSASFETTDWDEIVMLYDVLIQLHDSPVFRLNRAVALSFAADVVDGLAALMELENLLDGYLPFYAAKGDFLRRMGREEESISAYMRALRLTDNDAERRFFRKRLAGH